MRDQAAVNNVAMEILKVVYPLVVDIGCYSHTLDHVGKETEDSNKGLVLFCVLAISTHICMSPEMDKSYYTALANVWQPCFLHTCNGNVSIYVLSSF